MNTEMQKALAADGEKLRALTGQDHGPYFLESDCEDQALMATKNCTQCRTGFTDEGAPIYPALVKRGDFWCCPVCHGSYGTNPHPDLT